MSLYTLLFCEDEYMTFLSKSEAFPDPQINRVRFTVYIACPRGVRSLAS